MARLQGPIVLLLAVAAAGCFRYDQRVEPNARPVAVVQSAELDAAGGATVVLDGSESSDPDGDELLFRWTQILGEGVPVTLEGADTPTASFVAPDSSQRLYFQLVVSDGIEEASPMVVRVDVSGPANLPPVAAAPERHTAMAGDTVVLDGSDSADPEEEELTYRWSQVEGSGELVRLRDAYTASASFVAPADAQTLFFRLVVNDGVHESVPAVVRVDVRVQPNTPPLAVAVDNQTVMAGDTLVLDGSDSVDPEEGELTYLWSQVEGSGELVVLRDAATATASFVAPAEAQMLFFRLVVNDGTYDSVPAVVRVEVQVPPNSAPVAVAAADLTAAFGETVVLDGGESVDPEGLPLSFVWEQLEGGGGEPVALQDTHTAAASFVAPPRAQLLFFRLVVSDGVHFSPPAVVRVEVVPPANERPLAATEALLQVAPGATVVLDGSGSSDPDDDPLRFAWSQVEGTGEPVNLSDPDEAVASFVAPMRSQTLFFQLVVDDGIEQSRPAVVRVEVLLELDGPPLAVAPEELSATIGDTVVLDGSESSDPEGDRLSYRWEQIQGAGDPVRLDSPASAVASFVAPDRGQTLFFRLTVSDGLHEGEPAITRVRVNGPPVADAGGPQQVANQSSLLLDGSGSHDPDGDAIASFLWRIDSAPAAAQACLEQPSPCLEGAASVAPTFTPAAKGDYLLSLVVGDGELSSVPHAVVVRSLNRPPSAVAVADRVSAPNTQTVNLDASGSSDPDGDAIASYRWEVLSLPPGATAQLNPPDGAVADPELTLGGRGSYFLSLTVTDSDGARSAPATLRVDASNNAPVADPGPGRVVQTGDEVALLGQGSDVDGDTLQYRWTLVDWPEGGQVSLVDADQANVRFVPLRKTGTAEPAQCSEGQCYVLELQVSDGLVVSAPRQVAVTATNRPPVADAGPDQEVPNGGGAGAGRDSQRSGRRPHRCLGLERRFGAPRGSRLPGGPLRLSDWGRLAEPRLRRARSRRLPDPTRGGRRLRRERARHPAGAEPQPSPHRRRSGGRRRPLQRGHDPPQRPRVQ